MIRLLSAGPALNWRRCLGAAVLAGVVGCGGGGTGTVSGAVKFKGQPLPAGQITFFSQVGEKPVLNGDIRDGRYSVANVPAGPAQVTVRTNPPPGRSSLPPGVTPIPPPPGSPPPTPPGKYVPLPNKYADPSQSGLTLTVKRGDQTFDIDLKP